MELLKETSLNQGISSQIYMLLYMGGTPPTNIAQLNAAVRANDFCDMWNKSLGCAYATPTKAGPGGVGVEYTTMFSPRAGCGQMKGGVHRMDAATFVGTGSPVVPDTIGFETAAGVPITDSGWFGLFVANMLCRAGLANVVAGVALSPRQLTEFLPTGHIVVGFNAAKTLTGIQCNHVAASSLQKFAVDYWNGSAWVECVANRDAAQGWVAFAPQVTTTKVRIRLQAGALPATSEVTDSFVLAEVSAPVATAVANITWALVIPVGSRPNGGVPSLFIPMITEGVIKRATNVPFYAMTAAGPGGSADIILTKATGLQSTDTPQPTGFYLQPGNMVEV